MSLSTPTALILEVLVQFQYASMRWPKESYPASWSGGNGNRTVITEINTGTPNRLGKWIAMHIAFFVRRGS